MSEINKLGRYEIIDELGRGGMGIVLLGLDPVIDRKVALKLIKISDEEDVRSRAELTERFFIEARAVGKLSHPNIVNIFDIGEETGKSFMAMEYVEGFDLAGLIKNQGALTFGKAASIIAQVADGLYCAHQAGVIHRDIKPANILMQGGEKPKISDFGLARLHTSHSVTQTGHAVGSPSYMSPEQVQGKHIDHRSDIFSLGVMFYEMVTGCRPFDGDSMTSLIFKIIKDEPPAASTINSNLPPDIDIILGRMMAKDPEDRYQSCGEVVSAINAMAQGRPLDEAPPYVSGDMTVDFDTDQILSSDGFRTKKSPPARIVIGVLALVAIIGGVFIFGGSEKSDDVKASAPVHPVTTPGAVTPDPIKTPPPPTDSAQEITTPTEAPTLVVNSTPPNADVTVDGKPFGTTPTMIADFDAGKKLTVVVSKQGYDKVTKTTTLTAGEVTRIAVTLLPTGGTMAIGGPAGAAVYLDNKKVGDAPLKLPVSPGVHQLKVVKRGFADYTGSVTIITGKTVEPSFSLPPLGQGELAVTAIPWGDVYVDGEKKGATPTRIKGLFEGNISVKLVNPGFRPYTTTVTITTGQVTEVTHRFTEDEAVRTEHNAGEKSSGLGGIAISSSPEGHVFINGKSAGTTPVTAKDLTPGKYFIIIKREGYPDYKREVTVVKDIVTRLTVE